MIDEKKLIEDLKKHFDALYKEDGTLLQSDHICISEDVEDLIKFINEQPITMILPIITNNGRKRYGLPMKRNQAIKRAKKNRRKRGVE